MLDDGRIAVHDCYHIKDKIKGIPGRRWNSANRAWILPGSWEATSTILRYDGEIDHRIRELHERQRRLRDAVDGERSSERAEPIAPPPLKEGVTLYDHQVRAYNMALMTLGLDEAEA